MEGHHRHACNEAEASSLALRPALYLTLRPFPARLTPRVTPARRAGDFAVNRQLPRAELSSARIARALPGAQSFTGGLRSLSGRTLFVGARRAVPLPCVVFHPGLDFVTPAKAGVRKPLQKPPGFRLSPE